MSKLYDVYSYLKKSSNEDNVLYLFKSGIFLLFIDKDAIIASDILGLKLTNLTNNIVKCGFPAITNIDTDNCSVKEAYELLETYKNRAKNILT